MPLTTYIIAGGAILGAGGLLWWARRGGSGSQRDPQSVLEEYCLQFPEDSTCEGTRARAAANAEASFAERERARAEWDLGGRPPADPGAAGMVLQQLQTAMDLWGGPAGNPRSHPVGPKPALAWTPTWAVPPYASNGMTTRWNRLRTIGMGQVMVKNPRTGHDWAVPGPDTSPAPRITGEWTALGAPSVVYNLPMRTRLLQDEGRRRWQALGPGDREEAVLDWATYWRTVTPGAWQVPGPGETSIIGTVTRAPVNYLQVRPPGVLTPAQVTLGETIDFPAFLAKWSPPPGVQKTIQETLAIAAKNAPLRIDPNYVPVKTAVLTLPGAAGPSMMGAGGMTMDDLDRLLGR